MSVPIPESEPPLDPEELHDLDDIDPEDVESIPDPGPLRADADDRVVTAEPIDEVPD